LSCSSGCLPLFTSTQFNPQRGQEKYWIQPRGCREGSAGGSGGGSGGSSGEVSGGGIDPASGSGVLRWLLPVTLLFFRSISTEDGDPTGYSQQTIHAAANLGAGASEENVEEVVVDEDMEVDNETPAGDPQDPSTFDRLDELRGTDDGFFHYSLLFSVLVRSLIEDGVCPRIHRYRPTSIDSILLPPLFTLRLRGSAAHSVHCTSSVLFSQ
jgi:hypothetical protein